MDGGQFPLLSQIFAFLDERDFTVDRLTWEEFCRDRQIAPEKLQAYKVILLEKLDTVSDPETQRSLLEQILCCDPFDSEQVNALIRLWHQKSERQPEPFQDWVYGLAAHLLQIESLPVSAPKIPVVMPPPPSLPTQAIAQPTHPPKNRYGLTIPIMIAIFGLSFLGAVGLLNWLNKRSDPPTSPSATLTPNPPTSPIPAPTLPLTLSPSSVMEIDDAISTVNTLYTLLSDRQYQAASTLYGDNLERQFNTSFFDQFERVTVEDLTVMSQTDGSVKLIGINTYFYPDGSTQREQRTFTVSWVNGELKIVDSAFIRVLQLRRSRRW